MKGKPIRIICVGRQKQDFWKAAWEHYLHACRKWRPVEVVEVKDADASLPVARRCEEEGLRLMGALGERDAAIALAENGLQLDSAAFADFLRKWDEREQKRINFVIGGPFGLAQSLIGKASCVLSLSSMTWPHELARILLMEQIFRALCIQNHFPYHH